MTALDRKHTPTYALDLPEINRGHQALMDELLAPKDLETDAKIAKGFTHLLARQYLSTYGSQAAKNEIGNILPSSELLLVSLQNNSTLLQELKWTFAEIFQDWMREASFYYNPALGYIWDKTKDVTVKPQEAGILAVRYGLVSGIQTKYEDVGKMLGISGSAIIERERKIFTKLHTPPNDARLLPFQLVLLTSPARRQ